MKKNDDDLVGLNNDIAKNNLQNALNNSIYSISSPLKNEIMELTSKLKAACNRARIPMFLCIAIQNTETETEYINDCVLASTELSNKGSRISKLLLACNGAETKIPAGVQENIRELTEYLDRLERKEINDSVANVKLCDDRIVNYLAIGDGLLEIEPPQNVMNGGISFNEDLEDLDDYEE